MPSTLIDVEVVEERLQEIEARVKEHALWGGIPEEDVKLRAGLVLEELRDALRKGQRQWVSIRRAHELTGWHEQTLREYAFRRLRGGDLPEHWTQLEVRQHGRQYQVRLASVPENPRAG